MERVLCLAIGYVFGLIQTGYFYGKLHGVDIRNHGSGNSGTTNALRVLGKKAGLIVFAGDFLKTFVPCVLVRMFLGDGALYSHVLVLYTGLGVTLGHNYPFYLGFKGTVAITRYVSLGSLLVAAIFLAMTAYFTFTGGYGTAVLHDVSGMTSLNTQYLQWECVAVAFVIAAMAFWRHRANIKRLFHGTENKLGAKKS